jgi:hypothetical protein
MIKVNSEAAVINAINKLFPDSVITSCNFSFLSVPVKTNTKYQSYSGIRRRWTSPTHTQNVCYFGIPTY